LARGLLLGTHGDGIGGNVDGVTTAPASGPTPGVAGPKRPPRSGRVVGLMAAVGFSLAMWAFIAMAVLGVVLKLLG
jgi:hypothetical protein